VKFPQKELLLVLLKQNNGLYVFATLATTALEAGKQERFIKKILPPIDEIISISSPSVIN
jgi:hypothetical protein